jgi:hypothetical protein
VWAGLAFYLRVMFEPPTGYVIDTDGLRDLAPDVIDEHGLPRIMPAAYYAATTAAERGALAVRHGLYCLPTVELVTWLTDFIDGRKTIEIGAGNGRLAEALDIPATDAYLQDRPDVRKYYEAYNQPLIVFGPNVERLEAIDAIRKHRPQIVIAAWVTHRYDPHHHTAGGNMFGPDTDTILRQVGHYVLIGNDRVHARHPLWQRPHEIHHPPWLYSRAINDSPNFIAVWKGEV